MTDAASGTGIAYTSGEPELTPLPFCSEVRIGHMLFNFYQVI